MKHPLCTCGHWKSFHKQRRSKGQVWAAECTVHEFEYVTSLERYAWTEVCPCPQYVASTP